MSLNQIVAQVLNQHPLVVFALCCTDISVFPKQCVHSRISCGKGVQVRCLKVSVFIGVSGSFAAIYSTFIPLEVFDANT